jgi:ABC-2 type transport system ATP-binding protein
VRNLIHAMAAEKAIIISTHLLEEVDAVCTRAVIIDRGRVVADGTPANLLARSRHHNAVTLTLSGRPGRDRESRAAVAAFGRVRRRSGTARWRRDAHGLPARQRHHHRDEVTALAQAQRWDVKELYAEAGRLDDVFRSLTTQDTQRARERRAGGSA